MTRATEADTRSSVSTTSVVAAGITVNVWHADRHPMRRPLSVCGPTASGICPAAGVNGAPSRSSSASTGDRFRTIFPTAAFRISSNVLATFCETGGERVGRGELQQRPEVGARAVGVAQLKARPRAQLVGRPGAVASRPGPSPPAARERRSAGRASRRPPRSRQPRTATWPAPAARPASGPGHCADGRAAHGRKNQPQHTGGSEGSHRRLRVRTGSESLVHLDLLDIVVVDVQPPGGVEREAHGLPEVARAISPGMVNAVISLGCGPCVKTKTVALLRSST